MQQPGQAAAAHSPERVGPPMLRLGRAPRPCHPAPTPLSCALQLLSTQPTTSFLQLLLTGNAQHGPAAVDQLRLAEAHQGVLVLAQLQGVEAWSTQKSTQGSRDQQAVQARQTGLPVLGGAVWVRGEPCVHNGPPPMHLLQLRCKSRAAHASAALLLFMAVSKLQGSRCMQACSFHAGKRPCPDPAGSSAADGSPVKLAAECSCCSLIHRNRKQLPTAVIARTLMLILPPSSPEPNSILLRDSPKLPARTIKGEQHVR